MGILHTMFENNAILTLNLFRRPARKLNAMLKRLCAPLTLANQLALVVLLLALLGLAGMAVSAWLIQGIQGSAHAINKAGSLRMQSYRLLAAVPLKSDDNALLREIEQTAWDPELQHIADRDGERRQLDALHDYWRNRLAPALLEAHASDDVKPAVAEFVGQIDALVSGFDRTTEQRISRVIVMHWTMAILTTLLLLLAVIWLRKRLLRPWRQLMKMANAIGQRNFSHRVAANGRDEMATLGRALNSMSDELADSYGVLEARVKEKTAGLEYKNQILTFLWDAGRRMHSPLPLCERLAPALARLQQLTGLRDIQLRVYETGDDDNYQEFAWQPDSRCDEKGCTLCPRERIAGEQSDETLQWRLADGITRYGLLLARLPEGQQLNQDQQHLIDTLVEQITASLALERQQDRQQQLIVMEERAAIARELHDSIAQSLSCMKMQVSCLQMQGENLPEQSRTLLAQIRNELNSSWRQLRELLTTFRLQLNEPGLRPALEASCQEFSARLGFPVTLNYHLPPRLVPAHQAIHLVQIAREALSNALKHAGASEISVTATLQDRHVRLVIADNGCGVPENAERTNHYGLIIMRDRAQSLRGDCQVRRRESGGTEVVVTFIPDTPLLSVRGEVHEYSGTGNDSVN